MSQSLNQLEERLQYRFHDAELLSQALTHRSHSAANNERLEFLGDSILNCSVAAILFRRYGKLDEGDLSRVRANLVKQQSLYEIAQTLGVSDFLRLGEGELKSGGFRRPSILADTLEALFGAMYLDGGFEKAYAVIERLYTPVLEHVDPKTLGKDAKTLLQEYLQGHKIALPQYTVIATHGAAHNQQFEVECTVPKLDIKVGGSGASRRAAEQAAAKKALEEVQKMPALAKPKAEKSAKAAKKRAAKAAASEAKKAGQAGQLTVASQAEPKEARDASAGATTAPAMTASSNGAPRNAAASVEKPTERAAGGGDKVADKTADKATADKPADKASEKPSEKPSDKPADKADAAKQPPAAA
ncbi:Ribonuclease 3 [Pandoraea aquatica]|uniref:Ribonuclease 3 n=1 Tax=Pandoraea aquatica TaxID=2508290 RepID=A0A5E4V9L1_9BURK|nr:ribonuclease III [Pandoraea aquatica]VVE08918.1 Ribonuclease 3 [Pandoraea aquatica]